MSAARPGTAYLVGAGPGSADLVGLRALELVRSAEVLIHDRLIPASLVDEAPASCLRIDAGKEAGDHKLTQDQINAAIVEHALAGRAVVRLKGGDPYLFGRGGEEAAACRDAGVCFEVVPAVTSALAVPAAAGIPVTHRGVANHVTIVTASAGPDGSGDPDFAWLAASSGTVVLLMGLRRVAHVARRLVEEGAPASRPAAVVSRGTTARQRTVVGTLADIAGLVEQAHLGSPAIIVVGDVVRLRETLNWLEQQPLFGITIAVTRARAQASTLVARLSELGADVVECPVIRTEDADADELGAAVARLDTYDLITLTSANGATRLLDAMHAANLDARSLAGIDIAVVGRATADACRAAGIEPDVQAPSGTVTALGLLSSLDERGLVQGRRVLVVRAEVADERFVDGLRELAAAVDVVHAYRTVVEDTDEPTAARARTADLVTFSSASTVEHFARIAPPAGPRPPAVVIGPVTAEAARSHGFSVVAEADSPGVDGLVEAVLRHATTDRQRATAQMGA